MEARVEIVIDESATWLGGPRGLCIRPNGSILVSNSSHNTLVEVTASFDECVTVAGKKGSRGHSDSSSELCYPEGICLSKRQLGVVYIVDSGCNSIKDFDDLRIKGQKLSRICGSGYGPIRNNDLDMTSVGTLARDVSIWVPRCVLLNEEETLMLISDSRNNRILTISTETWTVVSSRSLDSRSSKTAIDLPPFWLMFDPLDESILFCSIDTGLLKFPKDSIDYEVVCGNRGGRFGYQDGPALTALFSCITGFLVSADGINTKFFIADHRNNRIRIYDQQLGSVGTLAGDGNPSVRPGIGLDSSFWGPYCLQWYQNDDIMVTNSGGNAISVLRDVGRIDRIPIQFIHAMSSSLSSNHVSFDPSMLHIIVESSLSTHNKVLLLPNLISNASTTSVEFDFVFLWIKDFCHSGNLISPPTSDNREEIRYEAIGAHQVMLWARSAVLGKVIAEQNSQMFQATQSDLRYTIVYILDEEDDIKILSKLISYLYTDWMDASIAPKPLKILATKYAQEHVERIEELTQSCSQNKYLKGRIDKDIERLLDFHPIASFSDVCFVTQDFNKIYAQKIILCSRSRYFNGLLSGSMKEALEYEIKIEEYHLPFFTLLQWIYTQTIDFNSIESLIPEVLMLSIKYGEVGLQQKLEDVISFNLDESNVHSFLELATQCMSTSLINSCNRYIANNNTALR